MEKIELQPGYLARIRTKPQAHWNSYGYMDKYRGQLVTIRAVYGETYPLIKIVEDQNDTVRGSATGWIWYATDFSVVYGPPTPALLANLKKLDNGGTYND